MSTLATLWVTLATFACLAFVSATPAFAQAVTTAALTGTVTDETGAGLPGATVIATHVPSGTEYGSATRADGRYDLRGLRVGGPYRVQISFIGYTPVVREGLRLTLGDAFQLDVQLTDAAAELGEVTVSAGGLFDPNRSGVDTNIDSDRILATPSIGRDLADFTRLTPQAYVENDDDDGPSISIAGQSNRYNSIYIDGAVSNDVFGLSAQGTNGGQTGSTPISIDAIEEFQIAISPFDVTQSGFTGGAINAVTRSGTNTFEGSLYSFLRNETLAGKTPGALLDGDAEGTRLPEFSNNRYGFRLGGPIVQDKLFFFVNGEILRAETPAPFSRAYAGDSQDRLGDIRQTLVDELGYDPGEFGDKVSSLDDNKVLVKLDWNAFPNHRVSARYSFSGSDNTDQFASNDEFINFTNNSEFFPNRTHAFTTELNSTFGNQAANKLIVGYTSVNDDRDIVGNPFPSITVIDGDGEISLGSEPFSTANVLNQDIFTVTNNLSYFLGNHTLTFGAAGEFYSISNLFIPQNFAGYEYGSLNDFLQSVCAAGSGASAYCSTTFPGGTPDPVSPDIYQRGYSLVDGIAGDGTDAIGAFDAFQVGLYVQDEYRVNSDLRVTVGLRADIPKVSSEPGFASDALTTTIPTIEAAGYDLNGALPGQTPAAAVYLSPRAGFNYDLSETAGRRLQLRGGTGVFTGRVPFVWPGGMFLNNGTNSGFAFRAGFLGNNTINGNPIPLVVDPQQQFTGADFGQSDIPSGRLEIFEENFRYPRVWRSSLGLDTELPGGFVGTLESQFTKTLNNIIVTNVNLNPAALTTTSGAESRAIYNPNIDALLDDRYDAVHRVGTTSEGYTYDVTARLQKELSNVFSAGDNLFLNLSYTFGDSFAINDGTSSQINTLWRTVEVGAQGPNDNNVLARSDFSIGHRILGSATFRKEFLNSLATTVSVFYTGESGRPFNYTIDNFDDLIGAPGYRDYGLVYVPNDISEMQFVSADDAAAYDAFISSSDYLTSRRGMFAERNGSRLPFEHIVDLKFEQELFANLGGGARSLSFTLDIFNFTNLLNRDWGRRFFKFTSSSNGGFELLQFSDFVDADNGDFTPVYSFRGRQDTEEEFFDNQIADEGTYASRWLIQTGFRLTF
ncbi:MAG: TonB-dependent receptor [Rubricoccaceae bacterium]